MIKPSPAAVNFAIDDKDLDDAALWAAIDSAAAAITTTTTTKLHHKPLHYSPIPYPSPLLNIPNKNPKSRHHHHSPDGEVIHEHLDNNNHDHNHHHHHHHQRPSKIARIEPSETSPPLAMVKHGQRTPTTPSYCASPEVRRLSEHCQSKITRFESSETSPPLPMVKHVQRTPTAPAYCSTTEVRRLSELSPQLSYGQSEEIQSTMIHSLAGRFPSVSLFKEYQNAAMAILEKSDYTMISGNPFIKKSGWRKISFYFNLSYEIKDKTIEFDDNRNVQRAEFVVRAHMQGGRFSDGWGSCERREKRFLKPNHDIPSTAETRAKNKACQDLLGIGEYRPGVHTQR